MNSFIDLYQPLIYDAFHLTLLKSEYNRYASQWNIDLQTNRLSDQEKETLLSKMAVLKQQVDDYFPS